jgi:hypothetical protein
MYVAVSLMGVLMEIIEKLLLEYVTRISTPCFALVTPGLLAAAIVSVKDDELSRLMVRSEAAKDSSARRFSVSTYANTTEENVVGSENVPEARNETVTEAKSPCSYIGFDRQG